MSKVAIIQANFYPELSEMLLKGAMQYLNHNAIHSEIFTVPGAFEIPQAIKIIAEGTKQRFDGFLALGAVIRGETSHYDVVADLSAKGLMDLGLAGFPIGNGILTTDNYEQALKRADTMGGNKGAKAAQALHSLIKLKARYGTSDE